MIDESIKWPNRDTENTNGSIDTELISESTDTTEANQNKKKRSIKIIMKSKKFWIVFSVVIIIIAGLSIFFCTRGTREIPGIWVSDTYIDRTNGKQGQIVLVISDSGKGEEIIFKEGAIEKATKGKYDIKAFSADFYADEDYRSYNPYSSSNNNNWTSHYSVSTGYHYNPITNQITSGQRTYSKTDANRYLYLLNSLQ